MEGHEEQGQGLTAELEDVESQLASVQHELDNLLCKQEELLERKRMLRAQLDSLENVKSQQEDARLQSTDWEGGVFPWTEKVYTTLKSFFKLESFRPLQLSSVNATLSRKDSILIMPTGGGKSLCYQLPACMSNGLTLVVSPLVSLMQDQLVAVKSLQIESCLLNASSTREEVNRVHREMAAKDSRLKLLYVTPEKIAKSKRFMSYLEKSYKLEQLSLIVIDEVHCASQWGHDFRPDYKKLGILKTQFPNCPILGLTATATSKVLTDVREILSLKQCLIFRASYNRPNLFYSVRTKAPSHKAQVEEVASLIKTKYTNNCGIVYCFSRKDCDEVTFDLMRSGISAGCYHSDLPPPQRTKVHMNWLNGSLKVIVATIAFGMGIDKPNVRFVIHHSISKSMENYYQESGRAGRDGLAADCVLFFRAADAFRQSTMVFSEHTGLQNLYTMIKYCLNETDCRRLLIAQSFGEKWKESDCKAACDICQSSQRTLSMPSTSRQSVDLVQRGTQVIEEDISEHYRALVELVENARGKDKRLTAQKLVESWRGLGEVGNRLSHIPSPSFPVAKCESILLQGILDGVLKEDFHFTPYTTICYVGLGRKAEVIKRGILKITRKVNKASKSTKNSTASGTAESSKLSTKQSLNVQVESKDQLSKKRKLPKMYLNLSDSDDDDLVHSESRAKRECVRERRKGSCSGVTGGVIEIESD